MSLCMCPAAQAFRRGAVILLRKYVFSLRIYRLVALSTAVFEQVEKFRVGQIHGRLTRSKICVGQGPHGPHDSGAYDYNYYHKIR